MERISQSFDKPGVLSTLKIDIKGNTVSNLVQQIAKHWFITFFKSTNFKGSEYHFFFAKPTQEIAEQFHFSREVLVLITR